jgi:Ca2+-binding EF-hand superfamily protein
MEQNMKTKTRYAIAFLAVAGALSTAAVAADNGRRGHNHNRLERADADKSGDITFEEFSAAMTDRFAGADADKDGKMTVGELADEIQRARAERMAKRMIRRFDTDGDGAITKTEVESRQKKRFALLDRDDSGKIDKDEMPRKGRGQRR